MSTDSLGVTEGSGVNIATHSFSEDSKTKHVERVAPGTGIITMSGSADISNITSKGSYPGTGVDCSGKSRIVLRPMFSSYYCSGLNARLAFYDNVDSIIGFSTEFGISNLRIGSTDVDVVSWTASTDFNTGDYIIPTSNNGHYYKETGTGGTTGNSEPAWPIDGTSVSDGTCTWTDQGEINWFGELIIVSNELGAATFKIRTSGDVSDGLLNIYSGVI